MSIHALPHSTIVNLKPIELRDEHMVLLQRFYEANPDYSFLVSGQPPDINEAYQTIHESLPDGWPYTKKWVIGYVNDKQELLAIVSVVSDLLAPTVWHIGLFMVATAQQGTGLAQQFYADIERWAIAHGAAWFRLGVVAGNSRAESFWISRGYQQTRIREGVEMGKLMNTVRVMVKPLTAGTIASYLAMVPRDNYVGNKV